MGTTKALVPVDGVPMAARAAAALTDAGADVVVAIGGDRSWATSLGLRWAADRWPGQGPLGGLATALLDAPAVAGRVPGDDVIVVVAACDQPWLTGSALAGLIRVLLADPSASAAVPTGPSGRRQPFPAAWRSSAGSRIGSLVDGGARRADQAFGALGVVDVELPPDLFRDVDHPEDLPPLP